MATRTRATAGPTNWYAALVAALVIGAVAVSWVVTRGSGDALAELDPAPVAVAVPVAEVAVDFSEAARLAGVPAGSSAVVSSGRSGTVTGVLVGAGDEARSGAPVYAVDGVRVVAYADEAVIFRSLAAGAKGPDVAAAQRLLSILVPEHAVAADGVMNPATVRAVRAYERVLGIASPTGVLDPTWFVRLPFEGYGVATVEVTAGAPAPEAGQDVLTSATAIATASVSGESRGPAGAYEFVTQGTSIPLERTADGQWVVTDAAAAAEVLLSGEIPVEGPIVVEGRTRYVDGAPGQAVPGAAVVTDAGGATCVVLEADRKVVAVTILGSGLDGAAQIAPVLPVGASVLVNPLQVAGDVTCP